MARNPELDSKIGAAMRALRKGRGLSGSEVAERMGYGANGKHNVNRWERGVRGIAASGLWRYLEAVGATFADLDHELGIERAGSRRLKEIARGLQTLADNT